MQAAGSLGILDVHGLKRPARSLARGAGREGGKSMALASGGCMVGHSATRGRGRGRGGGDKRLLSVHA
jgi:hypothetical protein